jgi:hypothetical protein
LKFNDKNRTSSTFSLDEMKLFVAHHLKDLNDEEFDKMKNFLYKADILSENETFNKNEKYIIFQTS